MHRRQLSNGGKAILTHEFFSDIREAGLLLIVLRESVSCRCMESLTQEGRAGVLRAVLLFDASRLVILRWHNINLVDPASSHMLVSKIKPCMSQYKLLHGETANGSLKQLSFIWWSFITWITMVILELIHVPRPDFVEGLCLLGTEPT